MVTVSVPATSANVGAGFDSLGLAVSMHNVFTFEESDRIQISSVDGTHVPAGSNNLVFRSARVVYDQLGLPLRGLRITQRNDIPMARGLGSSSACIVAGILGANALLGNKLTRRQMLTLATSIEGHPDNVAPAMLGGFVTSVIDEGQVYSVKKNIDPELAFAAFVQDFRLLTSKARAALPAMVSHKDAVYNLSRAALATAAFLKEQAPGCSVFAIGEAGLLNALYDVGITMNDVNPDYVVVGEGRSYSLDTLTKATNLVMAGAKLIGANSDVSGPIEDGIAPACRALVAPIEIATGKQAYFCGKPNPLMMRTGLRMLQCHSAEAVMVGDRMDTDVISGMESGMSTVLVLSGVSTQETLHTYAYRPTMVLDGVGDIPVVARQQKG